MTRLAIAQEYQQQTLYEYHPHAGAVCFIIGQAIYFCLPMVGRLLELPQHYSLAFWTCLAFYLCHPF